MVKVWPTRCNRHQALGYLGVELGPVRAVLLGPPVSRRRLPSHKALPGVPGPVSVGPTGLTWIFWYRVAVPGNGGVPELLTAPEGSPVCVGASTPKLGTS